MSILELQCVKLPKKFVAYNKIAAWLSDYCYYVKFCTLEACTRCFISKTFKFLQLGIFDNGQRIFELFQEQLS